MEYCLSCFLVKTKNILCNKCMKKIFNTNNIHINTEIFSKPDKISDFLYSKKECKNSEYAGISSKSFLYLNQSKLEFVNRYNNKHFLLKHFDNNDNINEQISQQIMSLLLNDKNVVKSFLVPFNNQDNIEYYYITKLFNHNKKGKLNKEFKTIKSILNEYDFQKKKNFENIFLFLKEINIMNNYDYDVKLFFKMLIYDVIINNTDRHLSNIGLLFNLKENKGSLAPIYDTLNKVISTQENFTYKHKYPISEHFREENVCIKNINNRPFTKQEFKYLSKIINLSNDEFLNIFKEIEEKLPIIKQIIMNSPLNEKLKEKYILTIVENCQYIDKNINTDLLLSSHSIVSKNYVKIN